MNGRSLLTLACYAWPRGADKRLRKIPAVGQDATSGHVDARAAAHSATTLEPLYRGLHELGYIAGQNLAIERRDGDWKPDRLPALAAELVGLKVEIIVAWSTPAAQAAKQATNSIPIIAAAMANPIGDELVASLARPGSNETSLV